MINIMTQRISSDQFNSRLMVHNNKVIVGIIGESSEKCKYTHLSFGGMSTALELDCSVSVCRVLSSVFVGCPGVHWGTDLQSQCRMVHSTLSAATSAEDK